MNPIIDRILFCNALYFYVTLWYCFVKLTWLLLCAINHLIYILLDYLFTGVTKIIRSSIKLKFGSLNYIKKDKIAKI